MGEAYSCPCSTRYEEKARETPRKQRKPLKPVDELKKEPPLEEKEDTHRSSAFENATSWIEQKARSSVEALSGVVAKIEQSTDVPSMDEIKFCFALATVAYLGDDIPPEEHYSPALFYPKTGEPVPKELQETLGSCLDSVFDLQLDHFINTQPSDTQGFIAHNDNCIVLCYRGSMQAQDWVTNAQASLVPWKPFVHGEHAGHAAFLEALAGDDKEPSVHMGHYNAFLTTRTLIQEHLIPQVKNVTKPTKLYICGHSLGGSLATMALAYVLEAIEDAHKEGQVELVFVTIGAPRIGNISFVLHVLDLLLPWEEVDRVRLGRFVNKRDIVPYSSSGLIFRHLGRALLLTDTGDAHMHDEKDTDTSEDDFINEKLNSRKVGDHVKDHLTGAYRDVMFKCEDTLKKLHDSCVSTKEERRASLMEVEEATEAQTGRSHVSALGEAPEAAK